MKLRYDLIGNVTECLDTSGNICAHYEYDTFGNITAQSGDLQDTFLSRFSTKPFHQATGISKYQLRDYLPALDRWAGRDPIEERGGLNLYGFVGNDPMNKLDHLGLNAFTDYMWPKFLYYWSNAESLLGDPTLPNNPNRNISCLNEGFYRHCVLTCMLKKVLSTGMLNSTGASIGAMWAAMLQGRDIPIVFKDWDYEDILSNLQGIYQSNNKLESCQTGCKKRYYDEMESRCCPHNLLLKKTDKNCCQSE